MRSKGVYGDFRLTEALMKEFVVGRAGDIDPEDEKIVKKIKESLGTKSFLDASRQNCRNLFIKMKFKGRTLSWSDLPATDNWVLGIVIKNINFSTFLKCSPHQ